MCNISRFYLSSLVGILLMGFVFTTAQAQRETKQVLQWTENVLLTTLSVSYDQSESDRKLVRDHYTEDAWDSLGQFFAGAIQKIKSQKLILQPVPVSGPKLVAQGVFSQQSLFPNIAYWKINQAFDIPQLGYRIDFSVVVIEVGSENGQKLYIQSLNMDVQNKAQQTSS